MSDQIVILIILLFLSGFFSSSEAALFSISQTKARHLADKGGRAGELICRMKAEPARLLATILIGNTLANVGAASLATIVSLGVYPHYAAGLATGAVTLLVLIFGEVFPKSLATRNNLLVARMTIYPIFLFSILFYPLFLVLNFIPYLTGKMKISPRVTEEELMTIVEAVEEEGQIKEEERELIHNIFEFDDTNASEIMTPRGDMFVIDADEPLDLRSILASGYTRIPVIEGDFDHVIGIINLKDLYHHSVTSDEPVDVRDLMRPPYFVPEHKKLDKLLHQFKKRRNHMAVVVDEHGGVSGLITLEDALEELVGDISDETDKEEQHIICTKPKEWEVLGKADVDEVNQEIPMGIPDSKEYDTFSGYVLYTIGRIPRENEEIPLDGFLVTVKEIEGVRIKKYGVRQV